MPTTREVAEQYAAIVASVESRPSLADLDRPVLRIEGWTDHDARREEGWTS